MENIRRSKGDFHAVFVQRNKIGIQKNLLFFFPRCLPISSLHSVREVLIGDTIKIANGFDVSFEMTYFISDGGLPDIL